MRYEHQARHRRGLFCASESVTALRMPQFGMRSRCDCLWQQKTSVAGSVTGLRVTALDENAILTQALDDTASRRSPELSRAAKRRRLELLAVIGR